MTKNKTFSFDENERFDDKKAVATYPKVCPLTANDIDDIIVTAFEGGVNYWCAITRNALFDDKPDMTPVSTWITHCLLEGKTLSMKDREDDESEEITLTLDMVVKGIALNAEKRPHDADLDNADAATADCIIQYAVFGKIVYG